MQEYLKLPVRFEGFFQRRKLDTCPLKESIARNLHLLITTTTGENKQDLTYGSQFWDSDYDIHMNNDDRREAVIGSLRRQIAENEKRLKDVSVTVNVRQAELRNQTGGQLRLRIEIIVDANLVRSNEPFNFKTGFFIGPLLFD